MLRPVVAAMKETVKAELNKRGTTDDPVVANDMLMDALLEHPRFKSQLKKRRRERGVAVCDEVSLSVKEASSIFKALREMNEFLSKDEQVAADGGWHARRAIIGSIASDDVSYIAAKKVMGTLSKPTLEACAKRRKLVFQSNKAKHL